ncbi:hypothetical protein BU15DRAFT_86850 [Melanogaster broomeanus]|nr:hypothetical protein BU15DRAFT_86850 [Melanogaster broomeanus]
MSTQMQACQKSRRVFPGLPPNRTTLNRSEEGDQPSTLVHESLSKNRADSKMSKSGGRKEKYAVPDETQEKRDARTVFIGNLSPEVATKRVSETGVSLTFPLTSISCQPLQKQLPKIESTRFRSVAFQAPTSKLPEANDEGKTTKLPRQHERDRASSWRGEQTAEASTRTDEKKFLTSSQKKKIAFIKHEIHSNADSVHAYIVFAYPQPVDSRPANLPPAPTVMDPFEAARLAVVKCNGTMFLDRMLRVDASSDDALLSSAVGDPKLTIFVGNLDFASKEDDLRVFFEGVVSAERGPASAELSQDGDKPMLWVTRVRMVRDRDTQLGKGFAYVHFADRTCVDEILALEPGKLKFAKRKLRVQRCKTITGVSAVKSTSPAKSARTSNRAAVPDIPKGDPSLGEKLVNLSKEERRQAKSTDADRVARRMAKKKARMALAKQGVPVQSKERERVRKPGAAKKIGGVPPKKGSRGRVRSEKSVAKRNTKK